MDSQPASSEDSNNVILDSTTEENLACEYAIYPLDGFSIDSISSLLASYPNAHTVEHVSVSGWGIMYWVATCQSIQG